MNNLNHCISIFTGDIPPSKALFLKLENAFLLANTHEIIEIVSQKANIETELRGWAKLRGHLYLGRENLKQQYSYKIQKLVKNSYLQKASWGNKMQGISSDRKSVV